MKNKIFLGLMCCLMLFGCQNAVDTQPNYPIIVFTFDDQHQSIYEKAFPILEKYDFAATNFVNSAFVGNPNRLSWEQLEILERYEGWETGGHTLHHINLPEYDNETVEYEIAEDKRNLLAHGLKPVSFALPSGHATPEQFEIIAKFYRNIRTSLDLKFTTPVNRKFLGYFAYYSNYTATDAIGRIVRGIENNEKLIFLGFHRITAKDSEYPTICTPEEFEDIVEFVDKTNLRVMPLRDAINEVCGD
jgi:peptidoglycan/xylan/chitin deacetylase (PgdA/CDA1 family)